MKKKLFILIILLASFISLNAQTAKDNYFTAQNAYNSRNYEKAVQYLDKVVQQLRSTNIRVQPLLIKALYMNKYYHRVLKEYEKYLQLTPNKELMEYSEITDLYKKSLDKIKQEEYDFSIAKSGSGIFVCDNFLRNYPDSPKISEINARKNILIENKYWQRVQSDNKESDYKAYLLKYPNGKYVKQANKKLYDYDLKAYNQAYYKNTALAYNTYLQNYPNGHFRIIAVKNRDKIIKRNNYMTRVKEKPFILGYTYNGTIDSMKLNYPFGITVGKVFTSSMWNDYGFGAYASKKGYGYTFGSVIRTGLLFFKVGYGKGKPEYRYADADDHELGFEKIPEYELESVKLFDFQFGIRFHEFIGLNFSVMGPFSGNDYSSLFGAGIDIMF